MYHNSFLREKCTQSTHKLTKWCKNWICLFKSTPLIDFRLETYFWIFPLIYEVIQWILTQYSLVINVIASDLLQLSPLQRHVRWYSGIPLVELDFGHQELCVLLDTRSVAVLQVTPQLAHLREHRPVSHRVLATQVVTLAQDLVQQMAELPGGDAVLQQRLAHRHRPERVRSLAMERADDRCPGMFHL